MSNNLPLGMANPLKDYDVLFKIVLIGDSSVGKTSILQRFADQVFSESHITTIGVDFKLRTIQVGNTKVKLQIWDTAGQEKFRVITKMYYRNAAGIVIAYDVTNGESFANTRRWIEEVKNNCGENGPPIVLVGNKSDLPNKIVSPQDQEDYAKLMKLPFFETSAKENINIDEVFNELARLMLQRQAESSSSSTSNGTSNGKSGGQQTSPQIINLNQKKDKDAKRAKCCQKL